MTNCSNFWKHFSSHGHCHFKVLIIKFLRNKIQLSRYSHLQIGRFIPQIFWKIYTCWGESVFTNFLFNLFSCQISMKKKNVKQFFTKIINKFRSKMKIFLQIFPFRLKIRPRTPVIISIRTYRSSRWKGKLLLLVWFWQFQHFSWHVYSLTPPPLPPISEKWRLCSLLPKFIIGYRN